MAAIVQEIYTKHFVNQKGAWPDYVKRDLIPRLNGFEVLMAPYAMAHIKLEMVLRDSGCKLRNERLRIFLTNTLEEHDDDTDTLFAQWLSAEAEEANIIKRDTPVMVVIGNPPYSGISSNMGKWINNLIEDYKYVDGKHFGEKKHWLHDDYVKFLRYGQCCIDETREGILAYINNHSFLDNPTFRGMRWSLLQSFDKIYIIDLHGNVKKREIASDGSPDKNVFNIQQGVSINLFIKTGKKKQGSLGEVFHRDLYGARESKYQFLWENNLEKVEFEKLDPVEPYYFFIPKNMQEQEEYTNGFSVSDLFPINVTGIITARDKFVIDFNKKNLLERMTEFADLSHTDDGIRVKYFGTGSGKKYLPGDSRGWKMTAARRKIKSYQHEELISDINYRPFDMRSIYYHSDMVDWGRGKIMRHFLQGDNVGLVFKRGGIEESSAPAFLTKYISESRSWSRPGMQGVEYNAPLYIYVDTKQQTIDGSQSRRPNLEKTILQTIATNLGLHFTSEEEADSKAFAPIDLLDYIYAALHSPAYRERYKEFLKIDFPRVPYPTDKTTFHKLAKLGAELRTLHLLENPTLDKPITGYPETGDNTVTKPTYKITNIKSRLGQVWINDKQYFQNVPETAWNFPIGGYQPAQKWLKDRKGRKLTHDDIIHYQKIIVALTETERLMKEIDEVGVVE